MARRSKNNPQQGHPKAVADESILERFADVLYEIRWVAWGLIGIVLAIALAGFHRSDPSWSHAAAAAVQNPLGEPGAWLADLLLYLFGFSAWICVLFCFVMIWWKRPQGSGGKGRSPYVGYTGFLLLLLGSSALEALRFYSSKVELPLAPGGMLGLELGQRLQSVFGFTGATLVLLACVAFGIRLFFNISWLNVAEQFGSYLESAFLFIQQFIAEVQDKKIGREVAQQRYASVAEEKRRAETVREGLAASFMNKVGAVVGLQEPTQKLDATVTKHTEGLQQQEPSLTQEETNIADSDTKATIEPSLFSEVPVLNTDTPLQESTDTTVVSVESVVEELPIDELATSSSLITQVTPPPVSCLPSLDLLEPSSKSVGLPDPESVEFTSRLIERKCADFGVQVQVLASYPGPVITRYEIEPAVGVKVAQIVNLTRDLARALAVTSVRVVETVPGKTCMALELPNNKRQTVSLQEVLSHPSFVAAASPLTVVLGKDVAGEPLTADLSTMPHLLLAGTTGSGKSVGVNAMIMSLLYKSEPEAVRLILIDPKMLELSVYEGIPHLLAPVITDMRQAAHALHWCVEEMERRYKLMAAVGVRNLPAFNQKVRDAQTKGMYLHDPTVKHPNNASVLTPLPSIVVVVDELADMMITVGKQVEELITRLTQKARTAGIHLILATQRPSVDVITGLIKANIPARIAFHVSSKTDSRIILDQMGAEHLLGRGDMLYLPPGSAYPTRVHGAFVADDEVLRVVSFLKSCRPSDYVNGILNPTPEMVCESMAQMSEEELGDPLYQQAVELVLKKQRASTALLQANLRITPARANHLIEMMEVAGIVSQPDGRGGRELLIKN